MTAVRSEVTAFAKLIEGKLRKNDHKQHWQDAAYTLDEYLIMLRDEVDELRDAIDEWRKFQSADIVVDPGVAPTLANNIGDECADVAAFALMIADQAVGPFPRSSRLGHEADGVKLGHYPCPGCDRYLVSAETNICTKCGWTTGAPR